MPDVPKPRFPLWLAAMLMGAAIGVVWFATKPKGYIPVRAAPEASVAESTPIVEDEAKAFAEYAGDAACQACHADQFGKWKGSHHGLAERAFTPELDKPAFEPAKAFKHATQTSTPSWNEGKPQLIALGFGDKTEPWQLDRVIGHDPLRQYLVPGTGGRLHATEACWDPRKAEWFNVYGEEDRKPGEWGHWTGRGMVWNVMCAGCHNTRVRKNYDANTDTYATAMAHPSVSCESCHGGMKSHVDWQAKNPGAKPDPTANKLDRDQTLDSCAMCHARRTELTGDFKPGDKFFDHFHLAIVDQSDLFYPDGQIRDEDYEFGPFMGSRMHHAGVRCVDCHDPHTAKRILPGNDLCMRCHTQGGFPNAPLIQPTAHTFHAPNTAGSFCTDCHMPQTTYMQRHPRHDHGFTIPDPLMTKQFGIPNACDRCHKEKGTDWALSAVEKWYGSRMERRTRTRTTIMAKARRGDADAASGLLGILSGDETPYWKASASLLLEGWLGAPGVNQALLSALNHDHPLVRSSAARSLDALVANHTDVRAGLERLLGDTVRTVRVSAAWSLRQTVDSTSQAGRELLHMLNYNADQPSGQMQLGQYYLTRGDVGQALSHTRRAVVWDQGSPPFRHDLAVMLSMNGETQEAIKELRNAIRLNPREAEYHFKLGLALAETRDLSAAEAAFRDAVKADERHARSWYNLGLLLNSQNKPDDALAALGRAEQANAQDADIPYAAATIFANLGRRQEAIQANERALRARPDFQDALQLRQMLGRAP